MTPTTRCRPDREIVWLVGPVGAIARTPLPDGEVELKGAPGPIELYVARRRSP